ncbi:zinc ribbon domain-containing protein [Peptoniphilus obesi]|uniref:zinc ribbon domain-containing protein n=1 Tax=Peptoniphilus obesi TaxID=1472765 RepID=UPI0004B0E52F|nr:zinc ribbon domain-containing protein [Peptoniphilus obesi]
MFCPNCGKKVSDQDNYCKFCGKNIRNVKITIDTLDQETDDLSYKKSENKGTSQSTIVFKPLDKDKLDDINSTNRIKSIIDEVDKKISNNIDQYKSNSSLADHAQGPKLEKNEELKDFSKDQEKFKTLKPTNKIIERDSFEDFESDNFDDSVKKKSGKKKRSLKEMWSDFINEDDDEFSIFSSVEEDIEEDNKNVEIAATSYHPESMENTMDIPKTEIENALSNSIYVKSKKADEKSDKSEKSEYIEDLNTNIIFDKNNKNYDAVLIDSKNMDEDIDEDIKEDKEVESLNYKSFTDMVNKQLDLEKTKSESEKDEKDDESLEKDNTGIINKLKYKFNNKDHSDDKDKDADKDLGKTISKNIEEVEEAEEKPKTDANLSEDSKPKEESIGSDLKVDSTVKDKKDYKSFIYQNILKFNGLMTNTKNKIKEKTNEKYERFLLIAACLLSIIPVIIASLSISLSFSFSIVFLIVIKILLKLAQFYLSLSVTVDKAWIDTSPAEIKENVVFNYFICEIFLLLGFLVSPFNGYLQFDILSAFTPLPLATILVTILAVLISIWQYWGQLKKQEKLNFIAWYVIVFLVIDFSAKIFFVFANLIIN